MKQYQITLDGRTFTVRLLGDPLQDQVEVEVDGKAFVVEVQDLPPEEEPVASSSSPARVPSPIPTPSPTQAPTSAPAAVAITGNAVTAPLPGLIKSVTVRPGQQVSTGDELLVIEAMKMDNVIRAAREGIVETIHIAEGHRVAYGELNLVYSH
jgi:biotin carboxyl carrier protein